MLDDLDVWDPRTSLLDILVAIQVKATIQVHWLIKELASSRRALPGKSIKYISCACLHKLSPLV
jgi:hypothetical protein